ncbi:MAG: phenylpyruvate tautomerase MIF-related protein, partial [Puniceicoccales bacterium]
MAVSREKPCPLTLLSNIGSNGQFYGIDTPEISAPPVCTTGAEKVSFRMPYLNIQTNLAVSEEARHLLLKRSSKLTAELLGKPESYMMVALKPDVPMSFAGTE